jgi:hypothetical protein
MGYPGRRAGQPQSAFEGPSGCRIVEHGPVRTVSEALREQSLVIAPRPEHGHLEPIRVATEHVKRA